MTDAAPEQPKFELQTKLPPEQEAGVHADMTRVWVANDTFVLDFLSIDNEAAPAHNNLTDEDVLLVPLTVVSRVRYSGSQIPGLIELLQNIHTGYAANTARVSINQQLDDLMKLDAPDPDSKS